MENGGETEEEKKSASTMLKAELWPPGSMSLIQWVMETIHLH